MKRALTAAIIIISAVFLASSAPAYQICVNGVGSNMKWSTPGATYYVNATGGPANTVSSFQSAMQTWTSVPSSAFVFTYGGTTASTATGSNDGMNIIAFGPIADATTLALNSAWSTNSGAILDSDIVFNSSKTWATNGSGSAFDFQSVATHELGHSLCLLDLYTAADAAKMMYGYIGLGEIKRNLATDDINGISALYPSGGGGCSYSINPSGASMGSSGGTGSVSVNTTSGCSWTAVSNDGWITVTSGASGSGNGTANYSVAPNPNTSQRVGSMTVAGNTFTVTQDGNACTYSVSPTNVSAPPAGGGASVSVTVGPGCPWTATSNAGWITITSGASGSGNGTVNYSVPANSTTTQRSGTMTVAGKTVTVTQNARCMYSISPSSATYTSAGGSADISMTTTETDCSWSATPSATWIKVNSGSSGQGNGTISYSVDPNTGTSRTATILITGQNLFNVAQTGDVSPEISVDPTTVAFGNVNSGLKAESTVTVRNVGSGDLSVGTLTSPDAPFSVLPNNCSGATVSPGSSCEIKVHFAPAATGEFSSSFDIPSDDADENPVTVSLTGTGAPPGGPDITVSPTSADFINIPPGAIGERTIDVRNDGTTDLAINNVQAPALPFSIYTDTCSGNTLVQMETCQIVARFNPLSAGSYASQIIISSNDPDEDTVTISLTGSSSEATNGIPTQPVLVYPSNGASGIGIDVTFKWRRSQDPDGDAISYRLFVSTDPNFSDTTPINVSAARTAALGLAFSILVAGVALSPRVRGRKAALMLAAVLISAVLLASCTTGGDDGDGSGTPDDTSGNDMSYAMGSLAPGSTYYWKVEVSDGKGGLSESDTYSFSTGGQ